MNTKEIIIDGVNVSECPELLKEYLPYCYCATLDKENQEASCAGCFCLFKIKQYMNNNKLIEELKYELQCTKEELKKYQDMAKEGLENFKDVGGCCGCGLLLSYEQLQKDYKNKLAGHEELKEIWFKAWKQRNKYKKALEEIEEIASKDYHNDSWADISIKLDEILNIINKVKDGEQCI